MTGLVIREITSTIGSPLQINDGAPVRRAYRKFGKWCLRQAPKFRNELIAASTGDRIHFLATRLQRNFADTADDPRMPRLLIQHTALNGLPTTDTVANIKAYHDSRDLDVYREVDTAGSEKSILVLPDEAALTNPDGDFAYLKPLLLMIFAQMVNDPSGDKFLHAYFGTMLAAKCR